MLLHYNRKSGLRLFIVAARVLCVLICRSYSASFGALAGESRLWSWSDNAVEDVRGARVLNQSVGVPPRSTLIELQGGSEQA